jgi:hypothetical protein
LARSTAQEAWISHCIKTVMSFVRPSAPPGQTQRSPPSRVVLGLILLFMGYVTVRLLRPEDYPASPLGVLLPVAESASTGTLPPQSRADPSHSPKAVLPPTHLYGPLPNSTTVIKQPIGLNPPSWCTISGLEGEGQLDRSERALLAKHVRNTTRHYVEWGTGSSTLWAIRQGVGHMTAIDTDKAVFDCLLSHPEIRAAVARGVLDLIYVDIDANSGGGKPDHGFKNGPQRRRSAYPDVSDIIRYHPEPHLIDAVLVDGRFRAAAIIKTASVVRSDTPIFIHDADREECE